MKKIRTLLWYDDGAEDAARLYTSPFPDSRILDIARYSEAGPCAAGGGGGAF